MSSVTDISDAIQNITIAETSVETVNNNLSEDVKSNIAKIKGKEPGDNNEVELTTKQDASVNTLITNILDKFILVLAFFCRPLSHNVVKVALGEH